MLCSQKIPSWVTKVEAVELESNVWIERSSVSIAVKMNLRIEDLLAAPSQSNASTEELPNHFMAYSKHRRKILSFRNTNLTVLCRVKQTSDNKNTAVTKADLNPQFHATHSSQRSYNAKEGIKRQIPRRA